MWFILTSMAMQHIPGMTPNEDLSTVDIDTLAIAFITAAACKSPVTPTQSTAISTILTENSRRLQEKLPKPQIAAVTRVARSRIGL